MRLELNFMVPFWAGQSPGSQWHEGYVLSTLEILLSHNLSCVVGSCSLVHARLFLRVGFPCWFLLVGLEH